MNEMLIGWKEIARYLNFSVRTAQRWERDAGLPVRRPAAERSPVCGVPAELDAWLLASSQSPRPAGVTTAAPVVPPVFGIRLALARALGPAVMMLAHWLPRALRGEPGG